MMIVADDAISEDVDDDNNENNDNNDSNNPGCCSDSNSPKS